MKELDRTGGYANDRTLLNTQLAAIPKQGAAEIAGLDAKLTQANDNILQSARGRGIGFSGIPIGEQAQYAATEYAPAVARVKAAQEGNKMGILQSLNGLSRDQRGQAQSIFDTNRSFSEQQRQFNLNYKLQQQQMAEARRAASAAQAASAASYLQGASGGGGSSKPTASVQRNQAGGFTFLGSSGKPITAAQYAKASGQDIRNVLQGMGQQGDKTAQLLYNQLNRAGNGTVLKQTVAAYAKQYPYIFGSV